VSLAGAYIHYAWEARGNGVAATVSDDGAHLFIQRLQDAQALLDSALKLGVEDSRAYHLLLILARAKGASREQTQEWYEAGMKLQPDPNLHVQMAEYLRPEWHGAPGDLEAFANQLPTAIPGDEGLAAFGHVIAAVNCYDRGRMFNGVYSKENLNGAARVFLLRYPDIQEVANYAGLFAWAGGDIEVARKAYKRIGDKGDPMVFANDYRFSCFQRWCEVDKVPTGELFRAWASLSIPVGLTFDSDARYLWCSNSNGRTPVQRIDAQSGRVDKEFYAPVGIYDIVISKTGNFIASPVATQGLNGVAVWNADAPLTPSLIPSEGTCRNAAFSPAGNILAFGNGTSVTLITLDDLEQKPRNLPCGGEIEAIEYSNDGTLLAVRVASQCIVFDTQSAQERKKVALKDRPLDFVLAGGRPFFFDQLNRLTYLDSYAIVRHDPELQGQSVVYPKCRHLGTGVSPDGKLLVECSMTNDKPCSLNVWDLERKKVVQKLEGHVCQIFSFAFSSDSKRLATGSGDGEVKIWDLEPALRSLERAADE
jgi:hypothetical protein